MDPKNNEQLPVFDDDSYFDSLLECNHKLDLTENDEEIENVISGLYDNSVYKDPDLNESTSKIDSLEKTQFQNNSKKNNLYRKNENSSGGKMLNDRKKNGILLKLTRKYQEESLRLEHKEIQKRTQSINNKIHDQKLSLDISISTTDNTPNEVLKQDKSGETQISISNQESDCLLKISDNDILYEVKKPDILVQKNENKSNIDKKKNGSTFLDSLLIKMAQKYKVKGEIVLGQETNEIEEQPQNNEIIDQKLDTYLTQDNNEILKESDDQIMIDFKKQDTLLQNDGKPVTKPSLDKPILMDKMPVNTTKIGQKENETEELPQNNEIIVQKLDTYLTQDNNEILKESDDQIMIDLKKPDTLLQNDGKPSLDKPILMDKMPVNTTKIGQKENETEELPQNNEIIDQKLDTYLTQVNSDILIDLKKSDTLLQNNGKPSLDKPILKDKMPVTTKIGQKENKTEELPQNNKIIDQKLDTYLTQDNNEILKKSDASNHDILIDLTKSDTCQNDRKPSLDKSILKDKMPVNTTKIGQKENEIEEQPQNNEIIDQKLDTYLTQDNNEILKKSDASNHDILIDLKKRDTLRQNDGKSSLDKPILKDKMPINTTKIGQKENETEELPQNNEIIDQKLDTYLTQDNNEILKKSDASNHDILIDLKKPTLLQNDGKPSLDKPILKGKMPVNTTKIGQKENKTEELPQNNKIIDQKLDTYLTQDNNEILKKSDASNHDILIDLKKRDTLRQNDGKPSLDNPILMDKMPVNTTKIGQKENETEEQPQNNEIIDQKLDTYLTQDNTHEVLKESDVSNGLNHDILIDLTKPDTLVQNDEKQVKPSLDKPILMDKMPINTTNQDKSLILTDDTTKSKNDIINYEKTKTENVIILKLRKDDDNMIMSDLKYSTKTCNSIVSEKGTFSFDEVEDKSINFVFNFLKLFNKPETEILYASNNEICQKVSNKIFDFSKLLSILNQNTLKIPDCLKISPVEEVGQELLDNKPDITITKLPKKYVETSFNDFEDIYPLENCTTVYDQDVDIPRIKNPILKTKTSIAKPMDGESYYRKKCTEYKIPIAHMNENNVRNMVNCQLSPVDYTIVPKTRKKSNKANLPKPTVKKNNTAKKSQNPKTNGNINPKLYQFHDIRNKPSSSANFVSLKNSPNFTVKMTKVNSHLQKRVKQVMDETIDKVEHQYAKSIQHLNTEFVKPEVIKLPIFGIISEKSEENQDEIVQKTNVIDTIADIIENIVKPIEKELKENSVCKNKVQEIVDQVVHNVEIHNQESLNIEEIVISDDEDTVILNSLNTNTPMIQTQEETFAHVTKDPLLNQDINVTKSICVEIMDAMLSTVETLCRNSNYQFNICNNVLSEEIVISDDEDTAILDSTIEIIEAREEIVSSNNEQILNQNSDTFQNLVCAEVTNMMINKVENCQEIEDAFNNSSDIEEVIIGTQDQSPEKSLDKNSENFVSVIASEDNPVQCPIGKETIQVINPIHSVNEKNDKNQLLCVENSINENYFINKLPVNEIKPLELSEECTKNASAFKIQPSSETIVHSPPPLALKKICVKSFSNQTDVFGSSYIPPLVSPVGDVQSLNNQPSTSNFNMSTNVPTIYSKKLKRRVPIDSPDPEEKKNEENTSKADGEKLKPKRFVHKKKTVPEPTSTRIMKLRNSIIQMAKPVVRNNSEDIDDVPLIERIKMNFPVNIDKNEKKSTKKKINLIPKEKKPMLDAKAKLRRVRKKLNFDQITSENNKSQPKPPKSLLKTKFSDILCSKTKNSNQPSSSNPKNGVLKLDNKNETKLNKKSPKTKQKTIVNNILVSSEKIGQKNNKKPPKNIKTKIEPVTPVVKLVKNPRNKSNKSPKILKTKNSDIDTKQENLIVSKLRNNKQFHNNEDILINSEITSTYHKKRRSKKPFNSKRKPLNLECSERVDILNISTEENVNQKLDLHTPMNEIESTKENDTCKTLGSNEVNFEINHNPIIILSDFSDDDKNKVTYDEIHPRKRCAKFSDSSKYRDNARKETPKNSDIDIKPENLIVSKLRNNKQFHSNEDFLTNSENTSTNQRNKKKEVLKKIKRKKLPKILKKSSNSKRKMSNFKCSEIVDILSISTEDNVNQKLDSLSPLNEIESAKENDTCKILGPNELNSEINHNPIIILSDSSDEDKNKVTFDGIHSKKRCSKFSDSSEYEDNVREETPKTKRFMNRVPITYENSDTTYNNNSNTITPKPIGSKRRKNPKKPIRKSDWTTFDSAPDLTGEINEKFIEFENTSFKFENPPLEDDSKISAQYEIESKSETKSTLSNVKIEDEAKSLNLHEINNEKCKHLNIQEIVKISSDTKLDPLPCLEHDRTDKNSPETFDVQNQSIDNSNFPEETLDTPKINLVESAETSPLQNDVSEIVEDLVQLPSDSIKISPSNYSRDTVDDFKEPTSKPLETTNSHEPIEDMEVSHSNVMEAVINDSHEPIEDMEELHSKDMETVINDSHEPIEDMEELHSKDMETVINDSHEPIEDMEESHSKDMETVINDSHEPIEDMEESYSKVMEAVINDSHDTVKELRLKSTETANKDHEVVDDLNELSDKTAEASEIADTIEDLEESPSKFATTQNNNDEVIEDLEEAPLKLATTQNNEVNEGPTETTYTPQNYDLEELSETNILPNKSPEDPEEFLRKPMETAGILDNFHEVVENVEESSMDIELNDENEEILRQVQNTMESLLNNVEIEMMKTSNKNDVLLRKCIFEPKDYRNVKNHEEGFALKCLMEVLGCVKKSEQESTITEDSTQKISTIDFLQDKKFLPNENQTVSNIQPEKQKNCDFQNPFVELLEICTMKNINKNIASFQEQTIFTFTSDNCSESNDNSTKNSEEITETLNKKDDIKESEEENNSDVIIVDSPSVETTQDCIQVTPECQDDATMVNNLEENQNIIENVEQIKQDMNEQSETSQNILKPVEHVNEPEEIYLLNTQDPSPSTSNMPPVEPKLDELKEIYLQNTQDPSPSASNMPPVEPKLDEHDEIYLLNTQIPCPSDSNIPPVEPKLDELKEVYLHNTQDPCSSVSNIRTVEPKLGELEEIYLQNTQDPCPSASNIPTVEPKLGELEEIYLQNTQDLSPSTSNIPTVEPKLDEHKEIYLQNTQDLSPSTSNIPRVESKLNVLEEINLQNAQDSSSSTSNIPTEELNWPSISKACDQFVSLLKRKNRKYILIDKIFKQLISVPEIRLRRLSDLEISKALEVPTRPVRRRPGRKRKIQTTPKVVLKEQKKNLRRHTESEKRLINNPSSRIRLQPVPPCIPPPPQPVLNNFSSRSHTNNSTAYKIKEQRELPPIDVRAEKLKKHLKKNGIKNVDEVTKTFKQLIEPQISQTETSNFSDTYPQNSQIMPFGGNYNPYDSMPPFFPHLSFLNSYIHTPISNYPPPPMYGQFYQYPQYSQDFPQYSQDFQSNQSFQNFHQERHKYPSTSNDTRTNINENEESRNEDSEDDKSSLKIIRVESIPNLTDIDIEVSSQESHENEQNIIQNTKANNRKRKNEDEEDEPERKRPA